MPELNITVILLLLSIGTGALGSVGQTRKTNCKPGLGWGNYTTTGRAQLFLLLLTLIFGIMNIITDKQEKGKRKNKKPKLNKHKGTGKQRSNMINFQIT
jgi:hypothetical protein